MPEEARRELLFTGDVSGSVSGEEFKDLLGHQKYSAYLNYWYGVVVEGAVVQCVEEEEWKRIHSGGVRSPSGVTDLAYRRVYGLDQDTLLKLFREKKGLPGKRVHDSDRDQGVHLLAVQVPVAEQRWRQSSQRYPQGHPVPGEDAPGRDDPAKIGWQYSSPGQAEVFTRLRLRMDHPCEACPRGNGGQGSTGR